MWGGARPSNKLTIRLGLGSPFVPVDHCPLPASTTEWTMWSHLWRPEAPGTYPVILRLNDPALRTRRLDRNFYMREVRIAET